uniref:Uncharacterized protein n=1 Tax=Rhodopseudomonas palustris (strain BisA53) TaxID=316055 RepID=Q07TJ1_RHOP5
MTNRSGLIASLAALGVALAATAPAQALTAQECSAKYQAAKTAGSLAGKSWNDFRKEECGADAAVSPAATTAAPKADDPKAAEAKSDAKFDAKSPAKKDKAAAATPPTAPAGPAVYPSAVDAKYAKESAMRSRLHTCADQWKINKTNNTTGGLRWIQKGGGYWSECNKKLKGA